MPHTRTQNAPYQPIRLIAATPYAMGSSEDSSFEFSRLLEDAWAAIISGPNPRHSASSFDSPLPSPMSFGSSAGTTVPALSPFLRRTEPRCRQCRRLHRIRLWYVVSVSLRAPSLSLTYAMQPSRPKNAVVARLPPSTRYRPACPPSSCSVTTVRAVTTVPLSIQIKSGGSSTSRRLPELTILQSKTLHVLLRGCLSAVLPLVPKPPFSFDGRPCWDDRRERDVQWKAKVLPRCLFPIPLTVMSLTAPAVLLPAGVNLPLLCSENEVIASLDGYIRDEVYT